MPEENKLKALHTNLTKKLPDFSIGYDQFYEDMQNEDNLNKLHKNIQKKISGFTVPYEQFKTDMYGGSQEKPKQQDEPDTKKESGWQLPSRYGRHPMKKDKVRTPEENLRKEELLGDVTARMEDIDVLRKDYIKQSRDAYEKFNNDPELKQKLEEYKKSISYEEKTKTGGSGTLFGSKNLGADLKARSDVSAYKDSLIKDKYEYSDKAQTSVAEKEFLEKTKRLLEAPEDISSLKDVWKGLKSPLIQDQLLLGLNETSRYVDLFGAAIKSQEGKELSDKDINLLESYASMQEVEGLTDPNLAYSVGGTLSQMVPYIAQFALTSGVNTGARAAVTGASKSFAKKALGYTAGAAAQAPFLSSGYTDYYKRRSGDFEVNETGDVKYKEETSQGIGEAAYKSYAMSFAEVFGEGMGEVGKVGLNKLLNNKITKVAANDLASTFRKAAKWDGPLWETAEEYITSLVGAGLTGETDELKQIFTKDGFLNVFLPTILMGGAFKISELPNTVKNKSISNKYKTADKNLETLEPEIADKVREIADMEDAEKAGGLLEKISEHFDPEQKPIVLDYIARKKQFDQNKQVIQSEDPQVLRKEIGEELLTKAIKEKEIKSWDANHPLQQQAREKSGQVRLAELTDDSVVELIGLNDKGEIVAFTSNDVKRKITSEDIAQRTSLSNEEFDSFVDTFEERQAEARKFEKAEKDKKAKFEIENFLKDVVHSNGVDIIKVETGDNQVYYIKEGDIENLEVGTNVIGINQQTKEKEFISPKDIKNTDKTDINSLRTEMTYEALGKIDQEEEIKEYAETPQYTAGESVIHEGKEAVVTEAENQKEGMQVTYLTEDGQEQTELLNPEQIKNLNKPQQEEEEEQAQVPTVTVGENEFNVIENEQGFEVEQKFEESKDADQLKKALNTKYGNLNFEVVESLDPDNTFATYEYTVVGLPKNKVPEVTEDTQSGIETALEGEVIPEEVQSDIPQEVPEGEAYKQTPEEAIGDIRDDMMKRKGMEAKYKVEDANKILTNLIDNKNIEDTDFRFKLIDFINKEGVEERNKQMQAEQPTKKKDVRDKTADTGERLKLKERGFESFEESMTDEQVRLANKPESEKQFALDVIKALMEDDSGYDLGNFKVIGDINTGKELYQNILNYENGIEKLTDENKNILNYFEKAYKSRTLPSEKANVDFLEEEVALYRLDKIYPELDDVFKKDLEKFAGEFDSYQEFVRILDTEEILKITNDAEERVNRRAENQKREKVSEKASSGRKSQEEKGEPERTAQEIAQEYRDEELKAPINKLTEWQKDLLTTRINKPSFLRYNDKSNITNTLAKSWFNTKEKANNNYDIDVITKDLSEQHSVDITPDDITQFIVDNPGKYVRKTTDRQKELVNEYKETTGKSIQDHDYTVKTKKGNFEVKDERVATKEEVQNFLDEYEDFNAGDQIAILEEYKDKVPKGKLEQYRKIAKELEDDSDEPVVFKIKEQLDNEIADKEKELTDVKKAKEKKAAEFNNRRGLFGDTKFAGDLFADNADFSQKNLDRIVEPENNQIKRLEDEIETLKKNKDAKIKESESQRMLFKKKDQTQTKAFKEWFKDSKVIDQDGNPLIVYHGTNSDFNVFDNQKSAQGVQWFSSDKAKIERGESGAVSSKNIMPVYLSIQKMAGWKEYESLGLGQIEDLGFDGIKLDDDYVIFEPTQIKSATDNAGTFDPKTADIRFKNIQSPKKPIYAGQLPQYQEQRKAFEASVKEAVKPIEDELNIKVESLKSFSNLPEKIKSRLTKTSGSGIVGMYDPISDKAFLFMNQLDDTNEAVRTVLHEITGHKGLRNLLGEDYKKVERDVYKSMSKEDIERISKLYNTDNRLTIADEYLAEMAESAKKPSFIKRAIAEIKAILRRVFGIKYSDNDIYALINKSKESLKKRAKTETKAEGVKFKKKETPEKPEFAGSIFDETERIDKKEQKLREKIKTTPKLKETHFSHTLIKNRIRDLKQGWTLGKRDTKESLNAVQKAIANYAKNNMPLDEAGKADVNRVLSLILNAKNPTQIEEAYDKINDIVYGLDKDRLISDIDKILKNVKPKSVNKKPKGGTDPDVYLAIDKIRAIRKLEGEAFDEYFDNIEDDDQESVAYAALFGNLKDKNKEQLTEAHDKISQIVNEGKIWYKEAIEKRKEAFKDLRYKTIGKITGGKGIIAAQDYPGGKPKKTGDVEKFFNRNQSFEWLLDKLSKDKTEDTAEGFMQEYFGDLVHQATNAESKGVNEVVELIHLKASEIFGKDKKKLARIFAKNSISVEKSGVTRKTKTGKRKEEEISQDEAAKKWIEWQDPTLAATFEDMGWDETTREELDEFLTPEIKKWAEWHLNEFYPTYYKGVNEKFREAYFANLPFNNRYSPIAREVTSVADKDDSLLKGKQLLSGVGSSSMKSRVSNINHLKKIGLDQTLAAHIADMEHFKAWVMPMLEIRSVFGSRSVQHVIKYEHGNDIRKVIDTQINDFASGGRNRGDVVAGLDKIRRAFVTAELGLNFTLFPKQMVSILTYISEMPLHNYAGGLMNLALNLKTAIGTIRSSETVKERYRSGWTHEVKAALKADASAKFSGAKSTFGDAKNFAMITTKAGDASAIVGGWTVYHYQYKKQKELGKTDAEAHKYALNKFERAASRSQQSARLPDTSEMQKGSFGKFFTMFKNSQQQYFRWESAAIRNLLKGRGSKAKNIKIIVLYHALLPIAFQAVANAFTDADDDKKRKRLLRAGIMGSFNGVLIASDIIEFILEKAMGEKWTYAATPIESAVNNLGWGVANISSGIKDMDREKVMKGVEQFAYGLNNMTLGLPYRPTKKIVKKVRDIREPERVRAEEAEAEFRKLKKINRDWKKKSKQLKEKGDEEGMFGMLNDKKFLDRQYSISIIKNELKYNEQEFEDERITEKELYIKNAEAIEKELNNLQNIKK